MIPLIDADVLTYEVGFGAETGWKGMTGEEVPPPFDYVASMLDARISDICYNVEATAPPQLFLTGDGNFRFEIAKTTPYKANRGPKPWHYKNIRAYISGVLGGVVSSGKEADDDMSLLLHADPDKYIVCTRDKDLRQVPGWHYGWELGNQPSFGPFRVTDPGEISLSDDRKKLSGWGIKFFYSQCLMGDRVDSIPGIPKCGPSRAFDLLNGITLPSDMFKAVREAYRGFYGSSEDGDRQFLEMGRLLWMTRELHPDGRPVLWEFPDD